MPARYAIARDGDCGPRLLRVPLGFGEEALVLFTSSKAAQRYSRSYCLQKSWYVRQCFTSELRVALLLGPYSDIDWILLDPLPGRFAPVDTPTNLALWHNFVDALLG